MANEKTKKPILLKELNKDFENLVINPIINSPENKPPKKVPIEKTENEKIFINNVKYLLIRKLENRHKKAKVLSGGNKAMFSAFRTLSDVSNSFPFSESTRITLESLKWLEYPCIPLFKITLSVLEDVDDFYKEDFISLIAGKWDAPTIFNVDNVLDRNVEVSTNSKTNINDYISLIRESLNQCLREIKEMQYKPHNDLTHYTKLSNAYSSIMAVITMRIESLNDCVLFCDEIGLLLRIIDELGLISCVSRLAELRIHLKSEIIDSKGSEALN